MDSMENCVQFRRQFQAFGRVLVHKPRPDHCQKTLFRITLSARHTGQQRCRRCVGRVLFQCSPQLVSKNIAGKPASAMLSPASRSNADTCCEFNRALAAAGKRGNKDVVKRCVHTVPETIPTDYINHHALSCAIARRLLVDLQPGQQAHQLHKTQTRSASAHSMLVQRARSVVRCRSFGACRRALDVARSLPTPSVRPSQAVWPALVRWCVVAGAAPN